MALLGATFVGVSGSAAVTPSVVASEACPQNDGTLTVSEADGSSATACSLVGDKVAGELGVLPVPDPGYIAEVEDMRVDGGSTSMSVETTLEGNIEVIEEGADLEGSPGQIPDPTVGPCDSQQYALLARKWYTAAVPWYINAGTIRADDLVASNAVTSMRSAMENITQQNNQCGMPDQVDIGQVYQGDTNATAAIGYNSAGQSTCAAASSPSHNGIHTVYFDNRQPNVLGTTCTIAVAHAGASEIVEADIELDNDANVWTTNGAGPGCSTEYDLEGALTHEFGHWFGLDHVSDTHQTMLRAVSPCFIGFRTLGKGDVLGLQARY